MFYEPQKTQYDLNFKLFGISVRIHPMFWLLGIFLGANSPTPESLFLWLLAVTVSILIHELGHALVLRLYGISSRIVLYSFGGLTIHDRTYHLRWFENAFVSFAGPAAGFVFLGLITLFFCLTGQSEILNYYALVLGFSTEISRIGTPFLSTFLLFLIEVNLFWGILNLMPIFPLDGGQITREFCTKISPQDGFLRSLKISLVTSVMLAVWFFFARQYFAALMFAWMAFSNRQLLQQLSTRRW